MNSHVTFHEPIFISRSTKPADIGQFHTHGHFEIYYFEKGKCTYLIGDRIYSLSPGDLIMMDGKTAHSAKSFPEHSYQRINIHFDPSYVQQLLKPQFTAQV
jgi:mannose-6-phosphate isomerase-like protein (cupin superfamily)